MLPNVAHAHTHTPVELLKQRLDYCTWKLTEHNA